MYILCLSVLVTIFIYDFLFETFYYPASFRYIILLTIICIAGSFIWISVKNGELYIGILILLVYTFVVKGVLCLHLPWFRDTPAFMATTENIKMYGLFPPLNLMSAYQSYYARHPGVHVLSAIVDEVLGFLDSEYLIFLFFGIFTILIPLFFYVAMSKYFSRKVSLTSAFFATLVSIFLGYDPYSRGTLAIPLMLILIFLMGRIFSEKEAKRSDLLIENILLSTLIFTHDFTSAIFAFFVICLFVEKYVFGGLKLGNRVSLILLILVAFMTYDIFYSQTVIGQTFKELFSLESQLSPEVILKPRIFRQQISMITRSLFWTSAGILCLMCIVNEAPARKNVLGFSIFSFTLILLSLITGFLPTRIWFYAYLILLPATFNTIIKERRHNRPILNKFIATVFIVCYIISQIASISPMLVAPYSVDRNAYLTGDFRDQWVRSEIVGVDWIYNYSSGVLYNNIIGDLGSYLIASKYPLKINAYLNQLRSVLEDNFSGENVLLIYRKEMENIVKGIDGYSFVSYETFYKNIIHRYNAIYSNGEIICLDLEKSY